MATLTVITVRWSHSSSPFCCYSKCLFLTTGLNWIIISGWKFLPWKRAAESEATGSWIHGHSNARRFSTARNSPESQWVKLTKYGWPQSDRPTSLAEPDVQHNSWSVLHTSTGRLKYWPSYISTSHSSYCFYILFFLVSPVNSYFL